MSELLIVHVLYTVACVKTFFDIFSGHDFFGLLKHSSLTCLNVLLSPVLGDFGTTCKELISVLVSDKSGNVCGIASIDQPPTSLNCYISVQKTSPSVVKETCFFSCFFTD